MHFERVYSALEVLHFSNMTKCFTVLLASVIIGKYLELTRTRGWEVFP